MKRLPFLQFIFLLFLSITSTAIAASKTERFYFNGDKIFSSHSVYTVVDIIGEGAFGQVYLVKNENNILYALKCYKPISQGLLLYSDALREFEKGQLLDHPHIVKTVDYFDFHTYKGENTQNLILEYLEGQTLYLTKKNWLSKKEGLKGLFHFCEALSYALSKNLMHLDLHAGNVMVTSTADIVVIDLASFFSFEELLHYVHSSITSSSSYTSQIINRQLSQTSTFHLKEKDFKASNHSKLKTFFHHHPKLFQELKQLVLASFLSSPNFSIDEQSKQQSKIANYKQSIENHYFNKLTDLCMAILDKAELDREERLQMKMKMKSLSWNYQEDLLEEIAQPLPFYLDQLNTF